MPFAAAHQAAVDAALELFATGANALDAALAAQAALCVVLPDACGLGGDALLLVGDRLVATAVNGVGVSARRAGHAATDGGAAVTVPGLVGAWETAAHAWGTRSLAEILAPAIRLADEGFVLGAPTAAARDTHRLRLVRGGATDWPLLHAEAGAVVRQPALAAVLDRIAHEGAAAFYRGPLAEALAAAACRDGGTLGVEDLAEHYSTVSPPVSVGWDGGQLDVQPPTSQGVLLAMALQWLEREGVRPDDHLAVELTEACFGFRDEVATQGAELLEVALDVDRSRAARRGGPRAYLHTAGVATADADGLVVSSLVSVFDDFGGATFVPEGGFVLNNRAGGFTDAPNAYAPGVAPVHTLAPALLRGAGGPVALATPGADGQVQTLLQVLARRRWGEQDWADAIAGPRWRSEGGSLLVEAGHPAAAALSERGHDLVELTPGDPRFGAVVCAGLAGSTPFAVGDWRREVATGAI